MVRQTHADHDTKYYPGGRVEPPSLLVQSAGVIWLAVAVVALPLIALLVVIGLIYEAVIWIDRRPSLPSWLHWAVSAGLGIVLAASIAVVVLDRL